MKLFVIQSLKSVLKDHISVEEISSLIEVPPSQELGDFAFPCFTLSKQLKKSPVQIAQELASKIKSSKEIEKVVAIGPYINFFINKTQFIENTLKKILSQKNSFGKGKTKKEKVIIEFSQANTHKAFHVGHIKGTSLGESIARILEFSGSTVIRANYQGDTGMHVAKWLWCYTKYHSKTEPKKDESWIASIYVDAVKRLTENPKLQEEVDEINRKLDAKDDKKLQALWKKTRQLSLDSLEIIYKELNTHFDKYFFEAEMEGRAKQISKELIEKEIAIVDEGATIVKLDKFNLGVCVLLRKDGTPLYSAKDLALAEDKFKKYKVNKSIHVVGNAQRFYFFQLFKILELMNFPNSKNCAYIPVMEVRFPHGKMSSRTGDNVLYSDFKKELNSLVEKEITSRFPELSKSELKKRSLAITVSAIKYFMLKQDPNKNLIFDKEASISFEGSSGPYLLYSYARANSILKKSKSPVSTSKPKSVSEVEFSLVKKLALFPEKASSAAKHYDPSQIANYAFELAQIFNEFYHAQKVIGSDEEKFRLSLVKSFKVVMKNSLELLGINPIEEM